MAEHSDAPSSSSEDSSAKSWLPSIQLITNLTVVAGIVVLMFELNQTKDLAQVQTYDNAYLSVTSRNLSLMGESPQQSIAKSIFQPERISQEDVVVLTKYYTAIVVSWRRLKDENAVGYFGGGWEQVVAQEASNLNNQVGRKWWRSYQQFGDPEIIAVVDRVLSETTIEEWRGFYQNLLPAPNLTK